MSFATLARPSARTATATVRDDATAWTDAKASARATRASLARKESGRRRNVDPSTCDRDYSAAEWEFMQAMQEYKRTSGRMFPTWSEALEVLGALGYHKVGDDAVAHAG